MHIILLYLLYLTCIKSKGIAHAISYMHHDCIPILVHRGISGNNFYWTLRRHLSQILVKLDFLIWLLQSNFSCWYLWLYCYRWIVFFILYLISLHSPTYYFKKLAKWGIPYNHARLVTLLYVIMNWIIMHGSKQSLSIITVWEPIFRN